MKIKHAHLAWVQDQVLLLAIFWSVVGLYAVLALYLILIVDPTTAPGTAPQYFVCLKMEEHNPAPVLTVYSMIIISVLSFMICLSIGMDLFCLWSLHHEQAIRIETQRKHLHQQDRNEALTAEKADRNVEPLDIDQPKDQVKMILNDLPVRSTLLNTLCLVPYIAIIAALGNISDDFSTEDKSYILGLPFLVSTIGRKWFVLESL